MCGCDLHLRQLLMNLQFTIASAVNKIDSRRALYEWETQPKLCARGKSEFKLKHVWDIFWQMIYFSNWQGNKHDKYYIEAN